MLLEEEVILTPYTSCRGEKQFGKPAANVLGFPVCEVVSVEKNEDDHSGQEIVVDDGKKRYAIRGNPLLLRAMICAGLRTGDILRIEDFDRVIGRSGVRKETELNIACVDTINIELLFPVCQIAGIKKIELKQGKERVVLRLETTGGFAYGLLDTSLHYLIDHEVLKINTIVKLVDYERLHSSNTPNLLLVESLKGYDSNKLGTPPYVVEGCRYDVRSYEESI